MGSLCCVAARPHGSVTSREWSIGRNEPFWRTNSSFSPPLSSRWEYQLSSEGLSYESHGDEGRPAQYHSSLSSNSKDSRSWGRGESLGDHHFSASEGMVSYVSSPSESLQNHHLVAVHPQGAVTADEFFREQASERFTFSRIIEGALAISSYAGSTSSHSDGSEYELTSKSHTSACYGFSNRRSFMSKPIHPLSLPDQTGDNIRTEAVQWGSTSSIDYNDISETLESESMVTSSNPLHEVSKCCLCERLLSQRSPWSSRRIVRSGDMPIISVLSCWHVYHAECLERATPKSHKHDPPCPLCDKLDDNSPEQVCRLKAGLSRLKSPGGEGPSRPWSCAQVGDCVEGALHAPKQGKMMSLSRNRLKRQLSLKRNLVKDRVNNLKRNGFSPPEVFHGQITGCPTMISSPSLKRW